MHSELHNALKTGSLQAQNTVKIKIPEKMASEDRPCVCIIGGQFIFDIYFLV